MVIGDVNEITILLELNFFSSNFAIEFQLARKGISNLVKFLKLRYHIRIYSLLRLMDF